MEIKLRDLKGKDRRSILKIINKSGIKLTEVFEKANNKVISITENDIKDFKINLNKSDKEKFESISIEEQSKIVSKTIKDSENAKFMLSVIDTILDNSEKIDEDLHSFISELSGLSLEQIDELDLKEYASLFIKLKDLFVSSGFFTI